jgi:hypothetical protein
LWQNSWKIFIPSEVWMGGLFIAFAW